MDQQNILSALETVKKDSKKRNFTQTVDLVINLKDINIKNPSEKIDLFVHLPKPKTKKQKVCALVDEERLADAKKTCDTVIVKQDFAALAKDKKKFKKIVKEHDFFVTQPHLMPEVATHFGKVLGPRGKMPNPKAGCIIPPKVPMEPLIQRLRSVVRLQTKNDAVIRVAAGDEAMDDKDVAENVLTLYNAVVNALPNKEANVDKIILKLTMSLPVILQGGKKK